MADPETGIPPQQKPLWRRRVVIVATIVLAVGAAAAIAAIFLVKQDAKDEVLDQIGNAKLEGLAVGTNGGVAAEEERCSEIGTQVLKDGGNAVDSAIAASLCSGVINSFSSGIGGGGFMVIRLPNGTAEVIDFRETAPAASTENMFGSDASKSRLGGLAVAVPGELRGFEAAHKKYGRLPWDRLFQPSIDLCENGFDLAPELFKRLNLNNATIMSTPGFREMYTVTDPTTNKVSFPAVGTRIYWKTLGKTLRTIATDGADAFYTGPIAESIIKTIRSGNNPGIMTLEDLKNYTVISREPVIGSYRGHRIITTPAPSSGPVLLQMLNVLEGYDLKKGEAGSNAVIMVEAMKWAFSSRTRLGDPKFVNINEDVAQMVSKSRSAEIRALIKNDKTFPAAYYQPEFEPVDTPGTMHVSVMDKDSMTVALTSTVNLMFGSFLMDLDTGIILNNEMDDFSSTNVVNAFLLRPARSNFIQPGKRPLSSMTPTIMDGELMGAFGASGGSRIITATAQSILNVIDYGMNAFESVNASRAHHQLLPENVFLEDGYPTIPLNALQSAGHNITMQGREGSGVQVILRLADGTINAGSDQRKQGVAAAY